MWMNDIAVSLTNHCSASCVSCQRVTARICCCVSCCGATAAAERRAAIDRHLLPAWRSAANLQQLTSGVPRAKDGQTDTQTDSNRSTSPASLALSSKPAAAACRERRTDRQTHRRTDRHTDGRADARASHRPCSTQSCPWVGLGWVELGRVGSRFFSFSCDGLGPL